MDRRHDLDWVRVCAFGVLVLYHVGMYYVTWDWHVNSPHASHALEPFMLLSAPWRLSLLFLVSGAATAFLWDRCGRDGGRFIGPRSWRLLLPLLFGMLVIVPPQSYFEVVEKLPGGYHDGYLTFWGRYLAGDSSFCREDDCLDLPTWNHLWFVAYLWVYTVVFAAIVHLSGARFAAWSDALAGWLTGWKIIALPAAVLAVVKIVLQPHFETTHGLVDDWYNHAYSFSLFMTGALLAHQARFWAGADAIRWPALGIALACWASMVVAFAWPEAGIERAVLEQVYNVQRAVYALCGWSAIVAACGFGHRHLNVDSAARRYLTEAVFPVYILHQTLIVSMAHMFKPARLDPVIEAAALAVLTLCISFGTFELVRRVPVLRPLFGLGPRHVPDGAATRHPGHILTAP